MHTAATLQRVKDVPNEFRLKRTAEEASDVQHPFQLTIWKSERDQNLYPPAPKEFRHTRTTEPFPDPVIHAVFKNRPS